MVRLGRLTAKVRAKDLLHGMNRTESDWAVELEARKKVGEIEHWAFESMKLKLASGAWYTPDFFVVLADGSVEFHETKGFMREAARVRLLTAAQLYPWFRFLLIKRGERTRWDVNEISAPAEKR